MHEEKDFYWKLLEPEYLAILMFCRKLMGDRDSGDDLCQDALMNAWLNFTDLRDRSAFRPWLYRIVVNTFKSTMRRPWWKYRIPLSPQTETTLTGRNPAGEYDAKRWLSLAFQAVSAKEQALVTLYELEDWTIEELAELFDKTEGAIKARLFRARRKMRDALVRFSPAARSDQTVRTVLNGENKCVVTKPNAD